MGEMGGICVVLHAHAPGQIVGVGGVLRANSWALAHNPHYVKFIMHSYQ